MDAQYGNDGTAQVENPSLPFLTITAALAAIPAGGLVYIRPGTYTDTNLSKNNSNFYFAPGAIVNANAAPVFTDSGAAVTMVVAGFGTFNCTGSIGSVAFIQQSATNFSIQVQTVTSDSTSIPFRLFNGNTTISINELTASGQAIQMMGGVHQIFAREMIGTSTSGIYILLGGNNSEVDLFVQSIAITNALSTTTAINCSGGTNAFITVQVQDIVAPTILSVSGVSGNTVATIGNTRFLSGTGVTFTGTANNIVKVDNIIRDSTSTTTSGNFFNFVTGTNHYVEVGSIVLSEAFTAFNIQDGTAVINVKDITSEATSTNKVVLTTAATPTVTFNFERISMTSTQVPFIISGSGTTNFISIAGNSINFSTTNGVSTFSLGATLKCNIDVETIFSASTNIFSISDIGFYSINVQLLYRNSGSTATAGSYFSISNGFNTIHLGYVEIIESPTIFSVSGGRSNIIVDNIFSDFADLSRSILSATGTGVVDMIFDFINITSNATIFNVNNHQIHTIKGNKIVHIVTSGTPNLFILQSTSTTNIEIEFVSSGSTTVFNLSGGNHNIDIGTVSRNTGSSATAGSIFSVAVSTIADLRLDNISITDSVTIFTLAGGSVNVRLGRVTTDSTNVSRSIITTSGTVFFTFEFDSITFSSNANGMTINNTATTGSIRGNYYSFTPTEGAPNAIILQGTATGLINIVELTTNTINAINFNGTGSYRCSIQSLIATGTNGYAVTSTGTVRIDGQLVFANTGNALNISNNATVFMKVNEIFANVGMSSVSNATISFITERLSVTNQGVITFGSGANVFVGGGYWVNSSGNLIENLGAGAIIRILSAILVAAGANSITSIGAITVSTGPTSSNKAAAGTVTIIPAGTLFINLGVS